MNPGRCGGIVRGWGCWDEQNLGIQELVSQEEEKIFARPGGLEEGTQGRRITPMKYEEPG
jgi:hypothetical protein